MYIRKLRKFSSLRQRHQLLVFPSIRFLLCDYCWCVCVGAKSFRLLTLPYCFCKILMKRLVLHFWENPFSIFFFWKRENMLIGSSCWRQLPDNECHIFVVSSTCAVYICESFPTNCQSSNKKLRTPNNKLGYYVLYCCICLCYCQ